MKISTSALVFVFILFLSTQVAAGKKGGDVPNVIFIICDDLNDSVEGFGGHPQAITPNMDRLARKGVKFVNAQCNVPICGPSRASLWSGLYPHTTGNFGYKQQQNPWRKNPVMKETVTLFEHLTNEGYKVFASGKIHHNGHEDWDIFKDLDGNTGFKVEPSMGPYPAGDKHEYPGRGNTHPDMPSGMKGVGWDSGFGAIRDISAEYGGTGYWKYKFSWEDEYRYEGPDDRDLMPDERCADYAIELLQQKHDKPFMLAIGFNRPHSPRHVPENYFDLYPLDELQLTPMLKDDLEDCAPTFSTKKDIGTEGYGFEKFSHVINNGGLENLKAWTQAYLACVTFVDDQLGRVLDALDESAYADNTIVIFTSDHGYHMGEKSHLFKNSVWEESTRVPMVIAGPDIAVDAVCTAPVSLIDLYPTLVDYGQLDQEPNARKNGKSLDGFTMRGLLENPSANKWEGPPIAITALSSNKPLEINEPGAPEDQHYSIRSERYRYVLTRNGEEELYDHLTDPNEWYNLASRPQYAPVVQTLRKEFFQVINTTR
ncbi:sulfatase [Puniceicoccales bacterium CK1056]|uniref:Sulfatase n=1 Tax=Oceanipulchritudo coccoides TaxID=2706888 RepID=A0A6B2M0N4_9BACT|nr:sulfatase [Oceanipulchritudo coccoides]NDV61879.1 sulfatase [Oceanipulchritudo coccoides]